MRSSSDLRGAVMRAMGADGRSEELSAVAGSGVSGEGGPTSCHSTSSNEIRLASEGDGCGNGEGETRSLFRAWERVKATVQQAMFGGSMSQGDERVARPSVTIAGCTVFKKKWKHAECNTRQQNRYKRLRFAVRT